MIIKIVNRKENTNVTLSGFPPLEPLHSYSLWYAASFLATSNNERCHICKRIFEKLATSALQIDVERLSRYSADLGAYLGRDVRCVHTDYSKVNSCTPRFVELTNLRYQICMRFRETTLWRVPPVTVCNTRKRED